MTPRTTHTPWLHVAATLLFGLVVLSMAASGVAAQGSVDLTLAPAESEIPADEETTFQLVVEGADVGVSAYQMNVTLSDSAVAEITAINVTGAPAYDRSEMSAERASFEVAMGFNVHQPAGEIVIAEITVVGTTSGESATLTIQEGALVAGQQGGSTPRYDIGERRGVTFDVVSDSPGDGTGDGTGEDSGDGLGPGIGIPGTLAALGGTGYLCRRVGGVG